MNLLLLRPAKPSFLLLPRLFTTTAMSQTIPRPPSPSSGNDHTTAHLPPSEKQAVHKNRMDRPPYSPAPASFPARLTGTCFCGATAYSLSRTTPLDAKFCHCSTCQRLHGAPFQWAAIVEKSDVAFTKGREKLVYWNPQENSDEYVLPCKIACGVCRTPIMDEGRNVLLLFPTLLKFESLRAKRKFYPSCHIFYSRRAVDVPDGLPKWSKHKDESELVPERLEEKEEKQEMEHRSEL